MPASTGNSTPVIVEADADLERAAARLAASGYTHAGQSCISVQRVYVQSAVFEHDASGTLVGGSSLYATARDWARFGQLLLQKGVWNGQPVLSAGYVDWMVEAHPASKGDYGRGHLWRRAPNSDKPGANPVLPSDAFWLAGHDGQSVAIVPSEGLVVVRLGLTPSKLNFKPAFLLEAVIGAVR